MRSLSSASATPQKRGRAKKTWLYHKLVPSSMNWTPNECRHTTVVKPEQNKKTNPQNNNIQKNPNNPKTPLPPKNTHSDKQTKKPLKQWNAEFADNHHAHLNHSPRVIRLHRK